MNKVKTADGGFLVSFLGSTLNDMETWFEDREIIDVLYDLRDLIAQYNYSNLTSDRCISILRSHYRRYGGLEDEKPVKRAVSYLFNEMLL